MDLSKFDSRKKAEEGEELAIEGTDVVVRIIGEDSATYRQYQLDQANKRAKNRSKDLSVDELDRLVAEEAASFIIDWKNVQINGQDKEYSRAAAIEACGIPWFREQVVSFARTRTNFLPKSQSN